MLSLIHIYLNFAWYSTDFGTPKVRISTNFDMSDAHEIAGKATAIEKTNGFNAYKASNKVSVTDYLQENTTYYYQYTVDDNWSDVYRCV